MTGSGSGAFMTDSGIVLGLIPARGGSKAIPGKNLVSLAGKPLLAYTAEAALAARSLDRVIVSTDDRSIAAAARDMGLEVPFDRPADLSSDETPMLPVIVHTLDWCEAEGMKVDVIVLLQPTSPLRQARHIDDVVARLRDSSAETVVSVVEVPHHFTPGSVMMMTNDRLMPFAEGPMILRRQDKEPIYARNGPAVLALRTSLIRRGALYGESTLGYEMDTESSLDIDVPEDLWLAEQYLRRRNDAATQ
jgi:CMP-N,N'-diacetyllegionaminic acid synthase